jgi:peptide chain release factor 1
MGRDAERDLEKERERRLDESIHTPSSTSGPDSEPEEPAKQPSNRHVSAPPDPPGPDPASDPGPGPPPDGGLRAWLQVLANHLIVFNTWGFILSFGIFQPYYQDVLGLPPSTVSWVGSIQVCLIFLVGTVSGRAFDAGYFYHALAVGSLLQLGGIFAMSAATQYWQLLLAQGVCQGLGAGIVFAPTVANTSTYFQRRRVMAISLGACGTSTGGIVFPLMAQQLLPRIGFAWTMRAMGLVVLASTAVVFATIRTRLKGRRAGPIFDLAAFREPTFTLFAASAWLTLWAVFFAYYYVRSYPLTKFDAPESTSFAMLLIINATGIPGRLIPAFLADRYFGPVTVFIPVIFISAVLTFAWAGVSSLTGNYVWVAIFGMFGAGVQSLFPSTCASLTKDLSKNGTRIGMLFSIVSIAALTGPPLAGKLIQVAGGSFLGAQIWAGVCMLLGVGFMVAARSASIREAEKEK